MGQRVPEIPHKLAVPAEREAFLRTAAARRLLTTDLTIPHVVIIDHFNQLTMAATLMVTEPFEWLSLDLTCISVSSSPHWRPKETHVFEFDELLSSETWPTPPDQAPHVHEASSSKQRQRLSSLKS